MKNQRFVYSTVYALQDEEGTKYFKTKKECLKSAREYGNKNNQVVFIFRKPGYKDERVSFVIDDTLVTWNKKGRNIQNLK